MINVMFMARLVMVVGVGFALVACGSDEKPEYVERPVEDLYNAGMNTLLSGNFKEAARLFDEVMQVKNYNDIQVEDVIEAFQEVEVKKKLK